MAREVLLNGRVFSSVTEAARYCDCERSTIYRAAHDARAMWCSTIGAYVEPRFLTPKEVVEIERACALQVKCPHCGEYHDVKVRLS